MKTKLLYRILLSLCLAFIAPPAFSADLGDAEKFDKFRLSVGWFNPKADTTIRLDATNLSFGTSIKLEDDVGLAKGRGLIRADGFYRFKRRHRIDFGYYDFERKGSQTISAVINWGDQTFPINATVNSFLNLRIIKVSYTYLVVAKRDTTVGLSIGFNFSDLETGLSAANLPISQTSNSNAPLPMLGINATHNLGSNFWLEAHAQFFYLKVGSMDGHVSDVRVAVNYRIKDNFGIGVGYNFFNIKINKSNTHFDGRFKLNFDGVQIFASVFF